MILLVGETYRNRRGLTVTIGGYTKENQNWVWSISGFWFDKNTGNKISYRVKRVQEKEVGEYYDMGDCSYTLVERVILE